ncbi:MAG: glycosyltransferase family 2 protein [Clostridia bacterium]|nr:glycosyltransferase family 2 protein [Clostridia bacterium]
MKSLSFVIPAYNEAENISAAIEKISRAFDGSDAGLRFIFVDDGSTDATWREIERAAGADARVSGVSFSKNFGKEAAIFAGLSHVDTDACIVMDADMQHPAEAARRMYELWRENPSVEIVEGIKRSRGSESLGSRMFAKVFYRFFNRATDLDLTGSSDFKLLSRTAVDELLRLPERFTFFRALSHWIGFETAQVGFDVEPRERGETKWSFFMLLKYGMSSVSSFSSSPMQIVTVCGFVFLIFTIILAVQTLVRFFMGQSLEGFTTVILILLFSGSIIMLSLGMIGYYVSRIYDELKRRPRYIVAKRVNAEEKTHREIM